MKKPLTELTNIELKLIGDLAKAELLMQQSTMMLGIPLQYFNE